MDDVTRSFRQAYEGTNTEECVPIRASKGHSPSQVRTLPDHRACVSSELVSTEVDFSVTWASPSGKLRDRSGGDRRAIGEIAGRWVQRYYPGAKGTLVVPEFANRDPQVYTVVDIPGRVRGILIIGRDHNAGWTAGKFLERLSSVRRFEPLIEARHPIRLSL